MSQDFDASVPAEYTKMDAAEVRDNFLALCTSHSGATSPLAPLEGQVWWDTTNKKLMVYNGSSFTSLLVNQSHSDLSDLSSDDHTQYLRTDGTRDLTGDWVANAGVTIDGLDISTLVDGISGRTNLIHGGGFEHFESDLTSAPPGWKLVGSATCTKDLPAQGSSFSNGYSVKIAPSIAADGIKQVLPVKPSTTYTISLYHKSDGGQSARVSLADNTSPAPVTATHDYSETSWTRHVVTFTTGSNATTLTVQLISLTAPGNVWFDHVTIYEGYLSPAYDHGTMEDVFARCADYKDGSTRYAVGVPRIECHQATLTFSGQAEASVTITFCHDFGKVLYLNAIQYLNANPLFAYNISVLNTTSATIEAHTIDGTLISGTYDIRIFVFGIGIFDEATAYPY